jgi:uncharacterized membrane protein/mono/diheme cytochrome c family protein
MSVTEKILKWLGVLLAAVAVVVVVAIVYVYIASERLLARTYAVHDATVVVPTDARSIELGRRLAKTRGCTTCHGLEAEGSLLFDEPFIARFTAPNLTRVVRERSDAELERIIRQGVLPDGRSTLAMPSSMFYLLSDEDLGAILAFLRGLPRSEGPATEIHIGPLGRLGLVLGQYPVQAALIDHEDRRPVVDRSDVPAYGRYLALTACSECHGSALEGGMDGRAPGLAAVAAYSRTAFAELMRTGKAIGDRELPLMSSVARRRFSYFTDEEIGALYTFLQSRNEEPETQESVLRQNVELARRDAAAVCCPDREPPPIAGGPWADAASRGVTFRALGNEPYWTFEVEPTRLTMITELGDRRTELPHDEPSVVGTLAIWQAAADSHEIVAVTERRPCTDTMSGERFPVTVTVTFDGTAYRGCGRFL